MKNKLPVNALRVMVRERDKRIASLEHQLAVEKARVQELRNGVGEMVSKRDKVVAMAERKEGA